MAMVSLMFGLDFFSSNLLLILTIQKYDYKEKETHGKLSRTGKSGLESSG